MRKLKEERMNEDDLCLKIPELSEQERMRLIVELPEHPTIAEVQAKSLEILARRPQ